MQLIKNARTLPKHMMMMMIVPFFYLIFYLPFYLPYRIHWQISIDKKLLYISVNAAEFLVLM